MHRNGSDLKSLVNLEDWQKIQDTFSEVVGATLRTIDQKGRLLTKTSGPTRLCSEIFRDDSKFSDFRKACPIKKDGKKDLAVKDVTNLKCPFGLDAFIIPIKSFGKRIAAYLVIGPVVLNKRKDKSEYEKAAREARISYEMIMDSLIEINVFSYNKIRSTVRLLSDMFTHMAQTGYHKKRLGEIGREMVEIDPLFATYYEEKILNALLSTCTAALEADSGSVMTVDKITNHLHIKVSSKLDEKVVDNADVKVGEGIAGLVAATAEPIVLPKDRTKNGISSKMKREYIKSSMIVPFNKANNPAEVYGVINLNVMRKGREFSDKDIAIVKELVNFASLALIPVR
jgi:ligand-binding sensor protein